jgi:hypothetical protein
VSFEEFTAFIEEEISGQKTYAFQDLEVALGRA